MSEAYLYDSHAHLADDRLHSRLREELARFRQAGGRGVLAVAARVDEWDRIVALTELPDVWGALGVHPFFIGDWRGPETGAALATRLAACPRLRAVGEVGLDFQHGRDNAERQERVFREQLEIAASLDLPVVFHNRKSWREFFAVLDSFGGGIRGVCHNFTGSPELAREILARGLCISFAGPVTYPNARRAHASARVVPADRILVETDAPDLPPWPRREAQSAPVDVRRVLDEVAQLRGESAEALATRVAANFQALFGREPGTAPA